MSRAGWSAGVLRASKLFHSVSTQGPVRTSKPSPWKIPSISRRTSVSGCRVPGPVAPGRQGHVHACAPSSPARACSCQRRAAAPPTAPSMSVAGPVGGLAHPRAILGRDAAQRLHQLGDPPLAAQVPGLGQADLLLAWPARRSPRRTRRPAGRRFAISSSAARRGDLAARSSVGGSRAGAGQAAARAASTTLLKAAGSLMARSDEDLAIEPDARLVERRRPACE